MSWIIAAVIVFVVIVISRASWGGRSEALDAQAEREAGAKANAALAQYRREQAAKQSSGDE